MLMASNKIVMGSFKDRITAKEYLNTMEKSLESNEQIAKIQFEHNLYLIIRESLVFNMVMVTLEPFDDNAVLESTLKEIKKISADAYSSRIKMTNIFLKKELIITAKKEKEKSTEKVLIDSPEEVIVAQENIEIEKTKVKVLIPSPKKYEIPQKNVEIMQVLKKEKTLDMTSIHFLKEDRYSSLVLIALFMYIFSFYFITRDKEEENEENVEINGDLDNIITGSSIVKSYPLLVTENIDMVIGFKRFRSQEAKYIAAIDTFIYEYYFGVMAIKDMMNSGRYEDVQELIISIKKAASLLGAEKLESVGKLFQSVFKNKSFEKSQISMNSFYEALDDLLQDIKTYREENV